MIPLRDHNPSGSFPFVTYAILGANVLVFAAMLGMDGATMEQFVRRFAFIPSEITRRENLASLVTSMFLHGGFGHILGNMMFLNIFGDNLEERLGRAGYMIFYLLCGLAGSGLQIFSNPASEIPNLGASGAIAGLMGGYLVLYPRHKIDILVPFGLTYGEASVPAFTMLGYWFVAQLFSGVGSIGWEGGGVAYFAHIGGFLAGVVLIKLMTLGRDKGRRRRLFYNGD